jgi:hypothetical protein
MEEKQLIKYTINDDLHLNVWHAEDDESTTPPFYYQNFNPLGGIEWTSREEVEQYFLSRFPAEQYEVI